MQKERYYPKKKRRNLNSTTLKQVSSVRNAKYENIIEQQDKEKTLPQSYKDRCRKPNKKASKACTPRFTKNAYTNQLPSENPREPTAETETKMRRKIQSSRTEVRKGSFRVKSGKLSATTKEEEEEET
jgi:hypothetical protein